MPERKQLGFRATETLHRKLAAESKRSGVPIQTIVTRAIEEYLKGLKTRPA